MFEKHSVLSFTLYYIKCNFKQNIQIIFDVIYFNKNEVFLSFYCKYTKNIF